MALPVGISAKAKSDIIRNAFWWARQHSVFEALEWEAVVVQQCIDIGTAPESYSLVAATTAESRGLREALVGKGRHKKYRAIFKIEPLRVVVVRLFGGEQDVATLINTTD